MGIALLLGTQVSQLTVTITNLIIKPILDKLISFTGIGFENITYNILTVEFKLGQIILALIQFLSTLFCIYIIWQISITSDFTLFGNLLQDIKVNIE
jgi:large-conductance mechanosensitive channel